MVSEDGAGDEIWLRVIGYNGTATTSYYPYFVFNSTTHKFKGHTSSNYTAGSDYPALVYYAVDPDAELI